MLTPLGLLGPSSTRASRCSFIGRLAFIIQIILGPFLWSDGAVVRAQETWTVLPSLPTSDDTSTTVQSKAWFHGHTWWAVLSSSTPTSGSWLYRLESNNTWTQVLKVSSMKGKADTKASGDLTHILIVSSDAQIVTIEYVPALRTYRLWPANPTPVPVFVGETGSLEVDSTGRLWLATDHFNWVYVYYADYPFSTFNGPVILTEDTNLGDVNQIVAFPNHTIGVFWGNGIFERWGFRVHVDGTDPNVWLDDEMPAAAGHENLNMADDHINLALRADGTLYAAVKPKNSSSVVPPLYLLVRRPQPGLPGGVWDNTLYPVDPVAAGSESGSGRRPQVVLDEDTNTLRVFYHNSSGAVFFRESDSTNINFGPRQQVLTSGYEYVSSTKDAWAGRLVVLTTNSGTTGVLITTNPGLVGYWKMDDGAGVQARDLSGWGNDATLSGTSTWTAGIKGFALNLDGSSTYGSVSDQEGLDATTGLTLSAWIKPQAQGAQDVISRATIGAADGYSLYLNATNATTNPGKVIFQLNEATSGNTFRVNSDTSYPSNGSTWMHVAATYDGTAMRMYINGVEEASSLGPPSIVANAIAVGIGAQANGSRKFRGHMDEVRIYRHALTAAEITDLASVPHADLSITKTDGVSNVTVGQQTTYTIQAMNSGPEDVLAIVSDPLPSRLTGATWTCVGTNGGSCTANGTGSINDVVDLPVGGSVWYTLQASVTPGSSTPLLNTATVSPNGIDAAPGNNSATDTDTILQPVSPVITTQPASVSVTAPSAATFSVVASGASPMTYQWRRNGSVISGATSSSYTINPTAVALSGSSFTVTVSNAGGSATSTAAILTVNAAPVPPSITTQPASAFAIEPGGATFSVVATGTSPLSYQWRRNGTAIPGATSASYTLNSTSGADSGASFTVVVSNSVGSATSSAAILTVFGSGSATLLEAHFDSGPDGFTYADDLFRGTNQAQYASGAHIASGGYTGGALRVQVGGVNSQNAQNMSGGWQTSFTLAGPTPMFLLFRHRLTEENTYESDEYTEMLVSFDGVLRGLSPNDYIARVVGGGPTTTGWQLVQIDLGLVSAGSHVLALGAYNNQKTYPNEFAEVLIDDLMLQVAGPSSTPPSITTPPANLTVTSPAQATFSVVASGTAPLSYQWRRNSVAIAGATSASYTLTPTAVSDSGAAFDVVVTNSAGNATSSSATLTVNSAAVGPTITAPPANVTVTAPAQAAFSVVATGTAPLSYQWRRNGTAIPGATSASYVLNPTAVSDNGALFSVVVSNSVNSVTSAAATLTVNGAAVAPSITTPPANLTVTAPASASFSVVATGTAPLSYQWRRNGTAIPGATSASYVLNPTAVSDSGAQFSVSVSNSVNTVTSAAATLTVLNGGGGGGSTIFEAHFDAGADGFAYADDLFRATTQPNYASGAQLGSGGFTGGGLQVLLGGINGSNIQKMSGGWQSSFTLATAGPTTLTFRYKLGITALRSDRYGQMLVSLNGVLYGVPPNTYVAQLLGGLGGVTATTGWQQAQIDLGSLPAGTHTLALGGYLSGKSASGETSDVVIDDVVVQNGSAGPVPPSITTPPANVTVTAPAQASFSVVATGTAPLSYQWRRNGTTIPGATSASYVLDPTAESDNGAQFSVDVSNSVSTVTSAAVTLTVNGAAVAPSITTQPANVTVTAPAQASFSVVATGTGPLSYQWRRNGTAIPGATSASYVLDPTAVGDGGALFRVDVWNSVDIVTSSAATLTVNAAAVAPNITTPPANVTVTAPAQATFSVVATGTAPLSYQWRRNGTAIPGATSASYALNPTAVGENGAQFSVDVSNSVNTVTSAAATLTVLNGGGANLLDANFDTGTDGFAYADDLFRATTQPNYASGAQLGSGGFAGGGLQVLLGGINGSNIQKMSGGWQRSFSLASAGTATLSFRYKLSATSLKSDRFGQMLVSVNGVLYGVPPNAYVAQVLGGLGGVSSTTGWQQVTITLGPLPAGTNVLALGGYLSGKSASGEVVEVLVDEVVVTQ